MVSGIDTFAGAMIALAVYALGKTFFWPTMLAVVGDRFPRTGAVAMSIMGGIGMMSAGLLGGPGLGYAKDRFTAEHLMTTAPAIYEQYKAPVPSKFLFLEEVNGLDGTKLSQRRRLRRKTPDQQTVAEASIAGDRETLKADAFIPAAMAGIYFLLFLYFRSIGGYRPVQIAHAGRVETLTGRGGRGRANLSPSPTSSSDRYSGTRSSSASPTWIWKPRSPFSARPFASSSTTNAVTWPLTMFMIVLPRAIRCTVFHSPGLMSAFNSSALRLELADLPRHAVGADFDRLAALHEKTAAALLVDHPGELIVEVDVGLIALQHPFAGDRATPFPAGWHLRAAELDAAVGRAHAVFELQFEISRLAALPDDEGIFLQRVLRRRRADEHAAFSLPVRRVAVPSLHRPVEDGLKAGAILEVERRRAARAAPPLAATLSGLLAGRRLAGGRLRRERRRAQQRRGCTHADVPD